MDKSTILNVQISAKILQRVAAGMTVQEAYDSVFGDGAYMDMAGKMYDELRAK
jgi:hypothetical protein